MTTVALSPVPILQFFDNAGAPLSGGSVLTQVGGVNQTTWQDAAATTPLPNPIQLNSRGEVSNATGISCQLFLQVGVAYTFTLFDRNGNQINQASYTAAAGVSLLSVDVLQYGADPSGLTDSTTAFTNACTSLGALGGTVVVPSGKFLIGSNLTIPASVTLKGPYDFTGSNGNNSSYNYATMSAIMLSSGATITLDSGACITGFLIYQSGMTFPQNNTNAFAGTAITFGGDDCSCHNNMILGFSQAILSVGCQRPAIYWNRIDALNGIKIAQCFDVARMHHCHAWPFVTVGGSGNPAAALRSGTAFQIGDGTSDSADFTRCYDCFSYGYQNGFVVQNSSNVTLVDCAVDYVNSIATTSVGLTFESPGNNCQMIGGTVSWQGTGVVVNVNAPTDNTVKLIGVSIFNPQNGTCISDTSGQLTAIACNFANATTGINSSASPGGVTCTDCYFDTVTTPYSIAGAGLQRSNIYDNTYVNCTSNIGDYCHIENQLPQTIGNYFGSAGAYAMNSALARGTSASPTTVVANDTLFTLNGSAYNGTSFINTVNIRGQVVGTISGSAMPSQIVFSATPAGSNTIADILAITGNGVNALGPFSPATPAAASQSGSLYQGSGAPSNANGNNGDIYFRTDTPGTVNQRVYIKSAGSWTGIV